MVIKRLYKARERTPSEIARDEAIRAKYQRERPTLEQLVASGQTPVNTGEYWDLMRLVAKLKAARTAAGKSLRDIAKETGIDHAALSRIEKGIATNPTFQTLIRYARAVKVQIGIVEPKSQKMAVSWNAVYGSENGPSQLIGALNIQMVPQAVAEQRYEFYDNEVFNQASKRLSLCPTS